MIKYGKIQKKHINKLNENFKNFEEDIENKMSGMEKKIDKKLNIEKIYKIESKFNYLETKTDKLYKERKKQKYGNNK